MTVSVHISADSLRAVDQIVARLHTYAQSRGLLDSIAKLVQDQTERRIRSEKTDPDGVAWRPWSPTYAATRGPQHSLLIDTTRLVTSFARDVRAHDSTVSTDVPYAAANQATRPFMGFGSASLAEVEDHVIDALATEIRGIAASAVAA